VGISGTTTPGTVWNVKVLGLSDTRPATPAEPISQATGSYVVLSESCRYAIDTDPDVAASHLSLISNFSSASQDEMLLVTTCLLTSLATSSHLNAVQIERALLLFLSHHAHSLEGLNIIAQVTRLWSESFMQTTDARALCITRARAGLADSIDGLVYKPNETSRLYSSVLTRTLESPLLREAASVAVEAVLRNTDRNLSTQRRALAGTVLQILRHVSDYPELKRVASLVFTTGDSSRTTTTSALRAIAFGPAVPTDTPHPQQRIVEKLLGADGTAHAERLTPNEFQCLRQLTGLSLDSFRVITDRIRMRATSESWARAAILDLARAPHAPEVTRNIRTAALGALVSEARKLGRLSSQIEKEIFAVSAEIPTLTYLIGADPSAQGEQA
jgi:hypothetical protein